MTAHVQWQIAPRRFRKCAQVRARAFAVSKILLNVIWIYALIICVAIVSKFLKLLNSLSKRFDDKYLRTRTYDVYFVPAYGRQRIKLTIGGSCSDTLRATLEQQCIAWCVDVPVLHTIEYNTIQCVLQNFTYFGPYMDHIHTHRILYNLHKFLIFYITTSYASNK